MSPPATELLLQIMEDPSTQPQVQCIEKLLLNQKTKTINQSLLIPQRPNSPKANYHPKLDLVTSYAKKHAALAGTLLAIAGPKPL